MNPINWTLDQLYSTWGFSFSMCLKFDLEAVVEQSFNEEEVQPASNLFTENAVKEI